MSGKTKLKLRPSAALNQISKLQELINEIKNEICSLPDWLGETQRMSSELEAALRQARTNKKIARAIAKRSVQELKERASDTAQWAEDVVSFIEQRRSK
ncbi:MAG: hypothetical protein QMD21_07780, partial [Candidatus Thermoplasmatota archaeon]|nr:hypothetical protein [Candidatus Thermoplasmatota archaeon]